MAEKKTTTKKASAPKKATKQANPKAVDIVTPVTPADETGLELTEERVNEPTVTDDAVEIIEEQLNESEFDYATEKEIMPMDNAVDAPSCEKGTDDHDAEACQPEINQEIETQEPLFVEDPEMVNDITNLINGLDGIKASKIGVEEEEVVETEKKPIEKKGSATTNTEEKNYFSEQFSRSWGGVMYDY